jgi:hypothetical protein
MVHGCRQVTQVTWRSGSAAQETIHINGPACPLVGRVASAEGEKAGGIPPGNEPPSGRVRILFRRGLDSHGPESENAVRDRDLGESAREMACNRGGEGGCEADQEI